MDSPTNQARAISILKRWGDVLIYGAIGALAYGYLVSLWSTILPIRVLGWAQDYPLAWEMGLFLSLFWANKIVGTRIRHFRHIFTYPPILVAILMALTISYFLPACQDRDKYPLLVPVGNAPFKAAALIVGAWMLQDSVKYISSRLFSREASPVSGHCSTQDHVKHSISDAEVVAWLKREEPIANEEADLFGHGTIAKTVLDRLHGGSNTVALYGDFGSGKSSTISIATELAEAKNERLLFARISCWGFETAASAQEAILSELIQQISEQVDCFAIRGIPSAYIEAISEHVSWFKSLGFFLEKKTPLQQLERLSPLLSAIRSQAVIVIEDADRNGKAFDVGQIQALLVQFREVQGLSFILAISSDQQIDFARVCEYLEIVPRLEKKQVLAMVGQVRDMLLRTHPPKVLFDRIEPLPQGEEDYPVRSSVLTYFWPWPLAIWGLLNTPRALKHTLRRVADVWPRLSGEVRIDDLVGLTALRVGAPEAFNFFVRNHDYFGAAQQKHDKNLTISTHLPESLKQEWLQLTQNKSFDVRAAAWVMKHLDSSTGAITGASEIIAGAIQSMNSSRRGSIYARRLLSESSLQDPISDQRIVSLIEGSKTSPQSLYELADVMTDSEFASEAFEDLAPRCGYDNYLLLLQTEIYAVLRKKKGNRACADNQSGFLLPWRMLRHNYPKDWEKWLEGELVKCIPGNIRLMNDIYHYWIGDEPRVDNERKQIHSIVCKAIRKSWEGIDTSLILQGLDPTYPYSIYHLIFLSYVKKLEGNLFAEGDDWSWLGPILLLGAKVNPSVMLPEIIMLLNTSSGDPALPRHAYDLRLLRYFFGKEQKNLLVQIANGFEIPEDMPEVQRYTVNAGIEQAKKLLASGNIT